MSAIHQAASEFGLQPAVDDKGALVFQCVQCFAVLKSPRRSNWSDHQKTHQKDRQRFPCTAKDCDATFYRLGDWRRHIKFHQGERSFECTSCGKAFGRTLPPPTPESRLPSTTHVDTIT
ncbi:hypothetical protein M427DRAFT_284278 [Gonapodya prolifera JEL478]|uniref:C2H2-type domain-containing protein n=1 Tax=Gonapodya prolifera (strain JEL478) TaxID=1344416 RepID=A0A139AJ11_GONPJ|nr:hypothetical protein M427DRAFT_284278 [Gonapodya prolifera JEL478]|eukprot:KXS16780.1 hypothetical protein M427DRAFT_284278 [Gonapodya prolifera JEL478]